MSCKAFPIQSYPFSATDSLLIDTNIWLFIYGPQADPNDWKTKLYSENFKRILLAKSSIFVDVLILSEFINRYSRIEFNKQKSNTGPKEFKTFRESPAFPPVAKAIAEDARRILKHCRPAGSEFESLDLNNLLAFLEKECADFNDLILAELCQKNNWKMITHDGDFKNFGITILSANRTLLS